MFAQVLQNSVYTFSVILTIFLTSLGLGSALASALCRRHWSPRFVLFTLLAVSGLLVGLTPLVFYRSTSGLQFLGEGLGWTAYVATVFARVALVLTIPTVIMGTIFPYLLKLSEARMTSAGRTIGQLASLNTLAAILGSLAAGFLLLEVWGLWASLRAMAIVYLGLAVFAAPGTWRSRPALRAVPALGIVLLAFLLTYRDFATVHLDEEHQERLVQVYEGSAGTVAVIHRDDGLGIKVNNHYVVGTSGAALNVRIQSFLPLSLHPAPGSVFYLGMGTGITAGGALPLPVERVTVCELSGDVVRASREHFGPFVNGLHQDSRVRILAEDGRTYLGATDEHFDLVIGDIFLTHRVGVGSLYTLEHFETVRDRLQPGGYFVQWLPMFELSGEEFGIIARTMLEVFPQLTLWRRGFSPSYPVYALLGQTEPAALDRAVLGRHFDLLAEKNALPREIWIQGIPLAAYAGNIGAARALFEHHPISTDDRTPLEYLAPIRERNARGPGTTSVLAWTHLAAFCDSLLGRVPLREDPYLMGLDQPERRQIHAGLAFYRFETHRRLEQPGEADAHLREYQRLIGEDGSAAK
jgi:spermidine synthase